MNLPSGKRCSSSRSRSSAREHVATLPLQLLGKPPRDGGMRDDRGLVGAEDRIVEGLGVGDELRRLRNVGGLVDIGGVVARADADRRIARRIGGAHHRRAAGREDQVDPVGLHDRIDDRQRRLVDHLDHAVGRACLLRRARDQPRRIGAAGLGVGVRGDDDGVPREERDDRLVEDRADRIGRRRQREDHAGRLRDLDDLALGVDAEIGEIPRPCSARRGRSSRAGS